MAQSQKLEMRQGQSLVMTAQLQQSIKLLQLSSAELSEFIDQEVEKNPLLSREDDAPVTDAHSEDGRDGDGDGGSNKEKDAVELAEGTQLREQEDTMLDSSHKDQWGEDEYRGRESYSAGAKDAVSKFSGEAPDLEQTISSEISLRDHLMEQLQVDITNPIHRLIGSQLIDMVDESGFLREDTDELANVLQVEPELIDETVLLLQQFDPTGIFARNLPECLALQLKEQNLFDPIMEQFIAHIDLLAKGELTKLQEICQVDAEEFAGLMADVRRMDPAPARRFHHDIAQSVVPDVTVRRNKKGDWQIELNSEALPRVLMDREYCADLSDRSLKKDDKKYLNDMMANANWLVKALDQRANTILRVATEIVKQQEAFFLHGIRFLKPLTLKDIALAIDVHESTVSRVTTQKYMATPRGIFEMKYFFTSSVPSAAGNSDVSSKTVMYYIQEFIDHEDPAQVLSDDAIVALLKNRNIDVARRTVAKYREALHIPSSVIRRKQKSHIHA